jgi:hypothetical protein
VDPIDRLLGLARRLDRKNVVVREDDVYEDPKHRPLPHRHLGDHAIDELRGFDRHSLCAGWGSSGSMF